MGLEPRSMEEIGATLKEIREDKGLSLSEIAKIAGITEKELAKCEESIKDMPMTDFLRVCKALGIKNPDDIIYEAE